ncbi:hypothetical protein H012_gp514 [Acanthamoeba polyphaga moumouvirus]|uniref:Minor capsid protein P8 central region domain-containing protein n=2 Tax=Moumouvirus TaxID=3080801 RepID=L7RCI1_9VIRU|nr:hypothetical protein H012_gp514 [Acanthamoeba polyphaga moumouvirus]AEX62799.1 hypothetical protein mv_R594 [Moumouvirus Monve]AGC01946.1 hypothetical protein Moumou_00410 [Acanthamoeba polyphaga moumouvirus]AQN68308.1 hypothetical protein [Saudi moumouvirus]
MSLPKGTINRHIKNLDVTKTPFIMFQCHKQDYDEISRDPNIGNNAKTKLSEIFFSPENINLLQKQIIYNVFQVSNGEYLIEKQNEQDLKVVMRSIFIQHAKHLPNELKKQIKELNDLVVDEVTPDIVSEIKSYFGYLDRAFGKFEPMDRPQNVSNSGTKTLPSITNIFN